MRVQTSNFQAEYGRSSGATITVVTRSGSKDFRGSAAFYKRDDALNGNEYSRRILCPTQPAQCDPPLYTFDNTAWTIGGPVLIPEAPPSTRVATSCSSSGRRTSSRAPIRAT